MLSIVAMDFNNDIQHEDLTPGSVPTSERWMRAVDMLLEYGVELPVVLLDSSDEDGTIVGRGIQEADVRITDIIGSQVDAVLDRIDDVREAIGQPVLTEAEALMICEVVSGVILLDLIGSRISSIGSSLSKLNPDAAADLKKALYEGMY